MINEIIKEENILLAIKTTLSGNHSDYANRLLAKLEFTATELKEVIKDYSHYSNGTIIKFMIHEPKARMIECFPIQDRIIHKAIWNIVNPILERKFVKTTYACIKGRGGFKASKDLFKHIQKHPDAYYLKVDVKNYFSSLYKPTLFKMLKKHIKCKITMSLLYKIMYFNNDDRAVPIGSVLSQTFGNFYLSKLDYQLERKGVKFFRYMDDIVIVDESKQKIKEMFEFVNHFLETVLLLKLNNRTVINKIGQGINFVGYIHYPKFIRIKKATAIKIRKNISQKNKASYFGILMHGNNYKLLSMYKERMHESNNQAREEITVEEQRQDKFDRKFNTDQWSLF